MGRHLKDTRFTDETERAMRLYEKMDVVENAINMPHGDPDGVDEMADLIRNLAGLNGAGHHDPDLAKVGRQAAGQWLRHHGYIK